MSKIQNNYFQSIAFALCHATAKMKPTSYFKITKWMNFMIVLQEIASKYREGNCLLVVRAFTMGAERTVETT